MDHNKKIGLAINSDVVAQIAEMAALEVDGVAAMGSKAVDFQGVKEVFSNGMPHSRSVGLTVDNGVLILDVYVKVKPNTRIKPIAERIQQNVKEKVQSMTGNAVAQVNVNISGIEEEIESETEND